jgi:hypothetical protein
MSMEDIKVAQRFIKIYLRKIKIAKLVCSYCTPKDRRFFEFKMKQLKGYEGKLKYWKKRESKLLIDLTNEDA